MDVYFSSAFIFLNIFISAVNTRALLEDSDDDGYYWKDFNDAIPKDALQGGTNSNGKTTYIGQVLHANQLIPAKIDPEQNKVYYEWGYKEYEATDNIKILCTKHPERFEWVNTGNGHIQNITDKNLLKGGYEAQAKIYIGRKQLENELAIGKIISTKIQSTLNTTKNGIGYQHVDFQVLAYNPVKTKPDEDENHDDFDIKNGGNGGSIKTSVESKCNSKPVTINFFI